MFTGGASSSTIVMFTGRAWVVEVRIASAVVMPDYQVLLSCSQEEYDKLLKYTVVIVLPYYQSTIVLPHSQSEYDELLNYAVVVPSY